MEELEAAINSGKTAVITASGSRELREIADNQRWVEP